MDLPEDMQSLIVRHVPRASLAPLAFVNRSWQGVCCDFFVSKEFWQALVYASGPSRRPSNPRGCLLTRCTIRARARYLSGCFHTLRLLGVLTSLCSGPADVLKLLRAMKSAAGDEFDFDSLIYGEDNDEDLGRQLVKCGHAEGWARQLVLECALLFSQDWSVSHHIDQAREDACRATFLIRRMRSESALNRGFCVTESEVLGDFLWCVTKETAGTWCVTRGASVLPVVRDGRVHMAGEATRCHVMTAVYGGTFSGDEYHFTVEDATEIGLLAASAKLPVDDMCARVEAHLIPPSCACPRRTCAVRAAPQNFSDQVARRPRKDGSQLFSDRYPRLRSDVRDAPPLGDGLAIPSGVVRGGREGFNA
jgi:hypothetical protein